MLALSSPPGASVASVRAGIDEAAVRSGRRPSDVTLVAVSKTFPVEVIREAYEAGQKDFGENRVQELAAKHAELGPEVRWHFVGRLQRNKVRQVVGTGAVVHSVDRLELAREISLRAGHPVRVLLEVNVSGEAQKGGVEPGELDRLTEGVLELPGLELVGLMTMAPRVPYPELTRPFFRELARLREGLAARYSASIHHLSMGMSQDYRVAVEEGATLVRVGESIFGRRSPRQAREGQDQLGESER